MGIRRKNVRNNQKREVLRLLKDGLSATRVASTVRLSPSTVYKIRREHERAEDKKELRTLAAEKHFNELFYFGQRLRDRLGLVLHEVPQSVTARGKVLMWSGWPKGESANSPKDAEEESVEKEWDYGRYDATKHSLFPSFQQHLAGCPCWAALEKVRDAFEGFRSAYQEASKAVMGEVRKRLPGLTDDDAKAMTESLLPDAYYRASRSPGLSFSYEPEKEQNGDKVWWRLWLRSYGVGRVKDPAELQPLALVHQELRETLPSMTELQELAKADQAATQATKQFQDALSPDARLRKLVLDGRCNLCP